MSMRSSLATSLFPSPSLSPSAGRSRGEYNDVTIRPGAIGFHPYSAHREFYLHFRLIGLGMWSSFLHEARASAAGRLRGGARRDGHVEPRECPGCP